MQENWKYKRGSEWRKWDLHIHSDASDGKMTCDQIVTKAIENKIDVIALTDHHTFKNIDKIKGVGVNKNISIISGIEFRTEYGNKSVHILALFPEESSGIILNTRSLTDLILSPLELAEISIINKGKIKLKEEGKKEVDITDDKAFQKGMFLVQVDFKKTADLVHKYGGLIIPHAGSKGNGIDEEMRHEGKMNTTLYDSLGTVKEELFKENYIDICEISKENDSEEFYLNMFNKPSIITSDAHKLKDVGSKFTWIKADPIFEGLKQIIYEPKERVKIQINKPESKAGYHVIDSIKLEQEKFWDTTLFLNSNLTTIIGGRSTGKSTLLSSIAKGIDNYSVDNSFVNEHIKSVQIQWQDGEQSTNRDIEFFPQSHMYEIAKDSKKTDNLIEQIIKEKDESKLLLSYKSFCDSNRTELINKINTLFQLQSSIDERKKELKEKGDKEGIKKEIELLQDKIKKINSDNTLTSDEIKEYEEIIKTISTNEQLIKLFKNDIEKIEALKGKSIFNLSLEYEFNSFSNNTRTYITGVFDKLQRETTKKWIDDLDKMRDNIKKDKEEILLKIKDLKDKDIYKRGIKHFQDNKQYQELQEKLKEERKKYSVIIEIEKGLIIQSEQNDKLKAEIVKSHCDFYKKATDLSQSLKLEHGGITIKPKIIFKKNLLKEFLSERLNQRGNERQNYVKSFVYNYKSKMEEYVNDFLNQTLDKSIEFKGIYSNKSQPNVSSELLSTNWFYISYNLTYQKDSFTDMSQGKQAFVILKLLLEFSDKKCPILIDQPEDSLDNRAIYRELVQYLKDKKKERQIIIVTHNPNVVVSADAEQIIVANQHGKDSKNINSIKFQYVSGSLENTREKDEKNKIILESQGIREHVCEILEGGYEAFKQRERKYAIK